MQNLANLEQTILESLRHLPFEKQQEVLDFTEFLRQKITAKPVGTNWAIASLLSQTLPLPNPSKIFSVAANRFML
jgi:hypothetical protein